MFAVLGFLIQAELSLRLAGSAVVDLEVNSIMVMRHYHQQLLFAKVFLQQFPTTIERARWNYSTVQKGIIGFMPPRAMSGASARIVLWLVMRRTPFDRGPKAPCWITAAVTSPNFTRTSPNEAASDSHNERRAVEHPVRLLDVVKVRP